MSAEGGDTGGDELGGSGKGSAGGFGDGNTNVLDTAQYGDPSAGTGSYAPTSGPGADPGVTPGPTVDQFVSNPTGGNPSVFDTGTTGVPNLSDPGPVGGDIGTPGAGGGSNTPYAFDNSQYLGGLDQYTGGPVAAGGTSVFDSGTSSVPYVSGTSGTAQPSFESMVGSTAAAPGGVSAASTAAPAGVGANPDTTSTDLSSITKKPSDNAGSGGASSSGGILESLGIKPNIGTAAAAAGLANTLLNSNKTSSSVDALKAQAAQGNAIAQQLLEQSKPITAKGSEFIDSGQGQVNTGAALQKYIATGTLPEGYEAQVQEAVASAKANAISNAAANGQPTDPKLNTTLAAQLNAIDKQVPAMKEQLAMQLATAGNSIVGAGNQTASTGNQLSGNTLVQAGLQATGISSDIYSKLATIDQNKQNAQGQAIANFASALNGGNSKGLTLKVA